MEHNIANAGSKIDERLILRDLDDFENGVDQIG